MRRQRPSRRRRSTSTSPALDAMASVIVRLPSVQTFNSEESNRLFAGLVRDRPLLLNVALRSRDGSVRAAGMAASASSNPTWSRRRSMSSRLGGRPGGRAGPIPALSRYVKAG